MNSRLFSPSPFLVILLVIFLVFIEIPVSLCFDLYSSCKNNQFKCGGINASFPFLGDGRPAGCGYPQLELKCTGNQGITTIEIEGVTYRVLSIDSSAQILKIVREDYLINGICPPTLVNTTFDFKKTLFDYVPGYTTITLLDGCPPHQVPQFIPATFNCAISGYTSNNGGYIESGAVVGPRICNVNVDVLVLNSLNPGDIWNWKKIEEVIKEGFEVKWKEDIAAACGACTESKGVCGYNQTTNQPTCYCQDQTSVSKTCPPSAQPPRPPPEKSVSLVIGLAIGGTGIVGLLLGFWIYSCVQKRKKKLAENSKSKDLPMLTPPSSKGAPVSSTHFSQTTPSFVSSKSDLEKGSTYFGVHVFSYAELEEATANFDSSRELGDGGFGTVYYGKLHDGRVVAVKRLYENNFKRVEQFMNEVEILTRLRHQNLVTLYGCTSKRSRELLLVYEYISNGTVADHLNGKLSNSGLLTWSVRLSIAIESADALAYLHKSDVIHRDVKTNNILLDENFRVKVADFGLSRLFPTDVTHVSTAPQGTPGYVDPEYYQCYQLTDKSDVYSFGVVLIELISSLPAVDTNRHRHDINLANMAINKIQNHALHELVDPSLGFEKDDAIRRMTTSMAELAFRCLQQERDMRPSMDEVVKILTEIQNEDVGAQKAEVVDIKADDVGLLKNIPLSLSPDSVVTDKWQMQLLRRTN